MVKEDKQVMISVIVPVYNVEKYIRECLESVLSQKEIEFELICINDGSTDSTYEIVKGYEDRFSNVRLYSQENCGLSASRNRGITLSKGVYIYFLDGDDKLAGDYVLCEAVKQMNNHKLDMMEFDADSFFETEDLKKEYSTYEKMYKRNHNYGVYEQGKELYLKLVEANDYYCSSCIRVYRRLFLVDNQLFFKEGIKFEDNLHTLACFLKAGRVMHTNQTIMLRRVRTGSIMTTEVTFDKFISYVYIYQGVLDLWEDYPELSLEEQFGILCEDYKGRINDIYNKLSKNEKEKINNLVPHLQYRIRNDILNLKHSEGRYCFPYNLFSPGEQLMIYGAGKIGKELYRTAQREGIVVIEGIVDQRGKCASEEDIEVKEINEIINHIDSKWLIAIENKTIAKSVKEQLIAMGVSTGNIYWDGPSYQKRNKNRYFIEQQKFLSRMLKNGNTKRMYIFMQPEHGNLGDYAISLGERLFLEKYFSEYEKIWITTDEWIYLEDIIVQNIKTTDVIFMNGGGYFGDIWPSGETSKKICTQFPNNIKIFFPNTLTYSNTDYSNNTQCQKDIEWIKKQKELHLFFRDTYSFEFLKSYSGINCYYAPDMALFIEPMKRNGEVKNGKILVCFRNDKEKRIDEGDEIVFLLKEFGYDPIERDIHLNSFVSLEDGYKRVKEFIQQLQEYEIVFTDRLHAMIMSVLAGVPCIATDNLTRKVSGVYPWINSDSVKIISGKMDITRELVKKVISANDKKYEKPTKEFDSMADLLRDIIQK